MTQKYEVVELKENDEHEYSAIIIQAFYESPQVPILIDHPHHTEKILRKLIWLYKKTGTIRTFGIRNNHELVCVGLCIDSDAAPSVYRTIRFGLALFLTLGFKGARQFWTYHTQKPHYKKKCLELILYGTKKHYQQQGYGRAMLNYLYGYAAAHDYGGVTGVTNSLRPAFSFYMRDGWIIDKHFQIGSYRICWVRKKT